MALGILIVSVRGWPLPQHTREGNFPKLPGSRTDRVKTLQNSIDAVAFPSVPSPRLGIGHCSTTCTTSPGFGALIYAFINLVATYTPRCFLSIHKRDRRGRRQPQVSPAPSVYRCALGTLSMFDRVSPTIIVRSGKTKGQISPRSWRRRSDWISS